MKIRGKMEKEKRREGGGLLFQYKKEKSSSKRFLKPVLFTLYHFFFLKEIQSSKPRLNVL